MAWRRSCSCQFWHMQSPDRQGYAFEKLVPVGLGRRDDFDSCLDHSSVDEWCAILSDFIRCVGTYSRSILIGS